MQTLELTDEQRLYLQYILAYFQAHARWPGHRWLEKAFSGENQDVDIAAIVQDLPTGLTSSVEFSSPLSKATLTIPAIYYLQKNAPELRTFLQVVKLCVNIYMHSVGDERQMSSGTVLQIYPTWFKPAIHKVGLLLQAEDTLWRSFALDDERWSCKLSRNVCRFRESETIEDYLEKRDPPAKATRLAASASSSKTGVDITAQYVQLHPDIHAKCWRSYVDADYDTAILNATKTIEVAVRKKTKLPNHMVGADLMAQAFRGDKPLLLYSEVKAEQEGMMSLLRGLIQVYKNPQSHRFVGVQNKSECLGILLMCSNLLHVIDNTTCVL